MCGIDFKHTYREDSRSTHCTDKCPSFNNCKKKLDQMDDFLF